jgi:hypothetical protein
MVEASADAYLTGGTRNDVAASRTRLDAVARAGERPALLWRGSLGVDHAAAVDLAGSLLESGADGLIAVLEPDAAVGPQLAAGAIGRVLDVLGPLAGRLGS